MSAVRFFLVGAVSTVLGCSLTSGGLDPDPGQVNFPMSVLATDNDLFVVNSNFDLTFNGAVVHRIGRADLEQRIAASRAEGSGGVVNIGELTSAASAIIDSHGAPSALSLDGRFLYIPVRSQSSLTVLGVLDSGGLDCGQSANGRCSDRARLGAEPAIADTAETFPSDPVGIAVGDLGRLGGTAGDEYLIVAHRGGRASLFIRPGSSDGSAVPVLVDVQQGLPLNQTAITIDPATEVAWMPSTFLSNDNDSSDGQLGRVAVAVDTRLPSSSFLFNAGPAELTGVSSNLDTRDIAFETRNGERFAYVLSRNPDVVAIVDLDRSTEQLEVRSAVPVGFGPSRLILANFTVLGENRTFVLASCYDSRDIYVIDPREAAAVTVIRGAPAGADVTAAAARFSGPFTMAFVPPGGAVASARLYVGDFRASTIRVVDFGPFERCLARGVGAMVESCEPVVLGTLGEPRPVGDIL